MKKSIICFIPIIFLAACEKEMEIVPINDEAKETNTTTSSKEFDPMMIDAVIDTPAEKDYIERIGKKYSASREEYEKSVSNLSRVKASTDSYMGVMTEARNTINNTLQSLERTQREIDDIYMPGDYKQLINDSYSKMYESLNSEMAMIQEIENNRKNDDRTQENTNKYKEAKDAHVKVNNYIVEVLRK